MNLNDRLQRTNLELYTQEKEQAKLKELEDKEYQLIRKINNLKLELRGLRMVITKRRQNEIIY